jgi:hypothetical protein
VPKQLLELASVDLQNVTGGGFRQWSFGAMTALSVAMGSPAGGKLDQPAPIAPISQIGGR